EPPRREPARDANHPKSPSREGQTDRTRDAAAEQPPAADPLDQLDQLLSERRRQLSDVERRQQLRERAKELKSDEAKHLQAVAATKRRRAAMFQAAGCEDEQQFRMAVADQHQAGLLAGQRDAVSREIAAAIGRHEPEESFAKLLAPDSMGSLD